MPPKKPKKKKRSKGEKREENAALMNLKARLAACEENLELETHAREKLAAARVGSMEVLAALEAEASLRAREREEAAERLREDHELVAGDLENDIGNLAAERGELEVELGATDLAVATNERLRHELYEARTAFDREAKAMAEEEARAKASAFEMRMQIEGLSRRTLRDLDADYKSSAETNIMLEAKSAAEHNRTLCKDLEARSAEAVRLLEAQSTRAKKLRDTRVVREMLADAKKEHDDRIQKITAQKQKAETTAIEKNAAIADAHAALRSAQTMHGRSAISAKRLSFLHSRLDATRASTVRRRGRALALARALDKCAVDYEARAALGAPPTAVGHENDPANYVNLVGEAQVGHDDSSATFDANDDANDYNYAGHMSNLDCIRMWNSKVR